MADVLNLKINERLKVERPNLRVNIIGNRNSENWFLSKCKYENLQNFE